MVPFVGPSHPLALDRVDLQRSINMYPVAAEQVGEKSEAHLVSAPGLVLFSGEPAPVAAIGWLESVIDPGGVAAQANAGVGDWRQSLLPRIQIDDFMYAGVVGYTAGAVVWSSVWAPTGGDASPTLTPGAGGVVTVTWSNFDFPPITSAGLLTISATLDGVPIGNEIEVSSGPTSYNEMAWGPVP